MKLHSLKMENFRIFRNTVIDFDGMSTVLFGINGTGKSTVLSAINYIFRPFVNLMNPVQSKAFERVTDELVSIGENNLYIEADVSLNDGFILSRSYKKTPRNKRINEATYPRVNYQNFKQKFTDLYIVDENKGMPIFVHYGTNRAVLDIPDRIRGKHNFDKLSAIERAMDHQLDFKSFFEWYREREADEVKKAREYEKYDYVDPS